MAVFGSSHYQTFPAQVYKPYHPAQLFRSRNARAKFKLHEVCSSDDWMIADDQAQILPLQKRALLTETTIVTLVIFAFP